MHWNETKDISLFKEVISEGVFSQKSGSRERGQSWQNVATILNLLDGFDVTSRSVRDRVTYSLKKFSAKNNSDVKATGEAGEEPTEYEMLMQDLLDLNNDSELKQQEHATELKNKAENEKLKALEIREMAMNTLTKTTEENSQQGPSEKRARRHGYDTMEFLREKIAHDKELREKELELKVKSQNSFQDLMLQQQQQQNMMMQQMQAIVQSQNQQMQVLMGLFANTKK